MQLIVKVTPDEKDAIPPKAEVEAVNAEPEVTLHMHSCSTNMVNSRIQEKFGLTKFWFYFVVPPCLIFITLIFGLQFFLTMPQEVQPTQYLVQEYKTECINLDYGSLLQVHKVPTKDNSSSNQPPKCLHRHHLISRPDGLSLLDTSFNATSEMANYEAWNVKMGSTTGWCGQREAFSYVLVDLQEVRTIENLHVTGVNTGLVKGRPTELRLFYRMTDSDKENYKIYAPNFDLTACNHTTKYDGLTSIVLPYRIRARYVILGIVTYEKNPCLKFELFGCGEENERN